MSFSVTILGTSAATPSKNRFMTAQLVQVENQLFLLDCAEATQFQLLKYHPRFHKINHIFISHLHGDHFLGLIGLLSTFNLQGRETGLHIYAPKGLDQIIINHFHYTQTILRFQLHFHQTPKNVAETILENDVVTIQNIPMNHRIVCNGFLIKEKLKPRKLLGEKLPKGLEFEKFHQLKKGESVSFEGDILKSEDYTLPPPPPKTYAFCSDSLYHEPIIPLIQQADLLYHEATFIEADASKAQETHHSTAKQAATIAQKAEVRKLILGHFSTRYKDLEVLKEEAKTIFQNTALAEEGEVYEV